MSMLFAPINNQNKWKKSETILDSRFVLFRDEKNYQLSFLHSFAGSSITNHHDFSDDLATFLYDNIFCHIQNPNATKIRCYSSYKLHDINFYGCTRNHNA